MSLKVNKFNHTKPPLNIFAIFFLSTLFFVFILNFLEVFSWGIWEILTKFWPIFLFMAILQFLSRKKYILSFIVTGLGIGIIISIIFYSAATSSEKFAAYLIKLNPYINKIRNSLGLEPGKKLLSTIKLEDNFPEVREREINISIAAGEFYITDINSQENFTAESQYYQSFGKPEFFYKIEEGILKINFETQKNLKPFLGIAQDTKYDISIGNTEIPTSLILDAQATSFKAKFQNSNLKSLKIGIGAGSSNVTINKNSLPKESLTVDVGAGTLKLILPFDAYLKINYIIGAGILFIDDKKFAQDGSFTTANFGISDDPVNVDVTLGAGTIFIDTSGKI